MGTEEAVDIWGSIYRFKALGAQTGNAYTLVEVEGRTGFETPLHSHDNEEEGFYILEGDIEVIVGDKTIKLAPGTFAFAPRGTAHGFRFGSDARILHSSRPARQGTRGCSAR